RSSMNIAYSLTPRTSKRNSASLSQSGFTSDSFDSGRSLLIRTIIYKGNNARKRDETETQKLQTINAHKKTGKPYNFRSFEWLCQHFMQSTLESQVHR